jgi:hypothetical protein
MNQDQILQFLMSQGNQQQQNPGQQLQSIYQNNPYAFLANPGLLNMMSQQPQPQQQQKPQGQEPSWMDTLNHTMMLGGMMGQNQQQYNPSGMGGGMMGGQQKDPNWWQRGLQGVGSGLSRIAPLATSAGAMSVAGGPTAAAAPFLLGGGLAAGALGPMLSSLGQPGQQQPTYQGGWV